MTNAHEILRMRVQLASGTWLERAGFEYDERPTVGDVLAVEDLRLGIIISFLGSSEEAELLSNRVRQAAHEAINQLEQDIQDLDLP